jgi:hypothetical protein
MGNSRIPSTSPDLFSKASDREPFSPSTSSTAPSDAPSSPRHVLPRDLPNAIRQLDDQELDRLLAAVLAERKRRGGKSVTANTPFRKQRVEAVGAHLTTGKLNAVRAAFKAGVKPSRIAKQFGLSDADVRKALASDEKKR